MKLSTFFHKLGRAGRIAVCGTLWAPATLAQEFVTQAAYLLAQAPQPDSNRDRFPQPAPVPAPFTPPVLSTPPTTSPAPTSSTSQVLVRKIEVTGSTWLSNEEVVQLTQPLIGKTVTLGELNAVADQITQRYLDQGYLTSRALLPDQTIRDGLVKIQVLEGSLQSIEVTGLERLNPGFIESRVQVGTPLSSSQLEEQLRLLRVDPLLSNLEASLRPGQGIGQSILALRITEAPPFSVNLGFDNYSPPAVGSERGTLGLSYQNLTGNGDTLSAGYSASTGSANTYDFNYRVPVNPMNGTLQLRASPTNNQITDPTFASFGIRGTGSLYEVSFRQPLVRTTREELALSVGFAVQDSQTFLFNTFPFPFGIGADRNGFTSTRVLKFGQDYLSRDPGGAWVVRSQFSLGLGVWNATINTNPGIPDGRFFNWLGQLQRYQSLGEDYSLVIQADVQLSVDPLLSPQQFVLGGGPSLRGYRQNVRAGDNGYRLSVEGRIPVVRDSQGVPIVQLAPFIETGGVWNVQGNPNSARDRFLSSVGLGLMWRPAPRLNVRLDYGLPLVNLPDRGTNLQDQGLYFTVNYTI